MIADGTRILLLSGHELSRYGLRAALESQPDLAVVAEAGTCREAMDLVAVRLPEVVVLDTVHPCRQARRVTRTLVGLRSELAVLIVANQLCCCTHRVLTAGARGVILKHVGPLELAGAVRSVASGYVLMPAGMVGQLGKSRCSPASSCNPSKLALLSARELEVLRWMVAGARNVEIAMRLQLSEGTVKSHVQHVLGKLSLPDRVHAVIYAYEAGFAGHDGERAAGRERDDDLRAPVRRLPVASADRAALRSAP